MGVHPTRLHDSHGPAIACQRRVLGEQGQLLGKRLRNERPVEGVGVVLRKPRNPYRVFGLKRQRSQPGGVSACDEPGNVNLEFFPAQARFYRDLPEADCRNEALRPGSGASKSSG